MTLSYHEMSYMSAEERLKETAFVVEATHFEMFSLWQQWHEKHSWEQRNGYLITVGYIGILPKLPVNISMMWDAIDGKLVAFWEPVSRMVDHKMIDDWIDKHFTKTWDHGRKARTNAQNFHHCLDALKEGNDV